jgi:hypothetical protein
VQLLTIESLRVGTHSDSEPILGFKKAKAESTNEQAVLL